MDTANEIRIGIVGRVRFRTGDGRVSGGLRERSGPGARIAAPFLLLPCGKAGFGDDTLYMEKLLLHPRHIEFQVLADKHGGVVIFDAVNGVEKSCKSCHDQFRNER